MSKPSCDDERHFHHSHRLAGIGLLFFIGGLFLFANCFGVYFYGDIGEIDKPLIGVFFASLGLILAEPFVLLIWLVMGNGSMGQRLVVCAALLVVLLIAFFLGISFHAFDLDRPVLRQIRLLVLRSPILLVPVLIWAACLPLVAYHCVLGRRLKRYGETPGRAVITIRGILLFTGLTALVLSCIQWFTLTTPPASQVWLVAGIGSAISATFSLLFVVTAVGRLMRDRGFWFWAWVWPAVTIFLVSIAVLAPQIFGFRDPVLFVPAREIYLVDLIPLMFSMTIVVFLAALRLLGFRICKP
ncbi:MAG: hypothetical protein P8K79_11570 [Mariniblastus sp.]|nr:hypothetical protein [Mariniblastus sp.]